MTPEEKDQRIAELEAQLQRERTEAEYVQRQKGLIIVEQSSEIERLRTALFDARAVLEAPPLSEMQFNGSTEMVKHICKKVDEAKRILAEVTDDTVLSSTPTAPTEECGACKGTGFTRTEYSNGTPNNTVYGGCDSCNATGRVGAPVAPTEESNIQLGGCAGNAAPVAPAPEPTARHVWPPDPDKPYVPGSLADEVL